MKILFMCVANAARSQLAEGLARRILPQVEVRSAGSKPASLHPYAVRVMAEIGIDISPHYSKAIFDLDENFVAELDYIITLCAEDVCPVLPSAAKKLHWPQPDPASHEPLSDAAMLARFRDVRDALAAKIMAFKEEIGS